MKALRSTVLLLLFGVPSFFTLLPAVALAQNDATVEAARERFNEGVEYFDNKEYERARLAFVQAYALKPHPAILLNLAQSEVRSGHEAAAATHFAQYLREHSEATAEQREAARQGLDSAKKSVGVVTLIVDPSGAEVKVDGETVGRSPLDDPLYLSPGEHSIVAEKGGAVARLKVDVSAGDEINRSLSIGAEEAAPAAAAAPETKPADEEEEEEAEEVEEEPAEEEEVAEDDAAVELDSEDDSGSRQPFFEWYGDSPVAWVGTGLVVVGLGAGTILAVSANNYYTAADDIAAEIKTEAMNDPNLDGTQGVCLLPWGVDPEYTPDPGYREACDKFNNRKETGERYEKYAKISFIGAGVALVGTIAYYFITAPNEGADAARRGQRQAARGINARLVPIVAPGQGGLLVQGSF